MELGVLVGVIAVGGLVGLARRLPSGPCAVRESSQTRGSGDLARQACSQREMVERYPAKAKLDTQRKAFARRRQSFVELPAFGQNACEVGKTLA